MEALEPRFFTAMAKVIMAYVDIDEQRQRSEKIMEQPSSAASERSSEESK
jgi:DNA-binding IclR family transcriptional regulator